MATTGSFQTFHCKSLEEALDKLKDHEVQSNSRFAVYTSTKGFGQNSLQTTNHVHWHDAPKVKIGRIEYSGVPFVLLGTKTFDCQFGKDRKLKAKEKRKASKIQTDHDSYRKGKQFLISESRKLDCAARCVMREVCHFPTYKITDSSVPVARKQIAEDLLGRLRAGEDVPYERNMIVCLPHISQHTGHPVGPTEVLPEPIDHRLSQKFKELVNENILETSVIRSQLNAFVKTICQPIPHPTNKRFYPTDKTIRNHVYMGKNQRLNDEQSKIEAWVTEMNKTEEDFIFCRLKSDLEKEKKSFVEYGSKFLFIYQTLDQKRLLRRYGSTVLIDATYKTTLYDMPLFFLAVKTNVDYQIVGCFMTEDETTESISEALSIMSQHCFVDPPPFFLTDFDESEITALEKVFPGSKVILCEFHREQAWERWVSKGNNSMGHKEEILMMLRKVAHAKTEDDFHTHVNSLRSSRIWEQNNNLKRYFDRIWYPHHKRWARAFRRGKIGIVAGTTNGIESQHKIFKANFLHRKTTYSLLNMLNILVKEFFPSRYTSYVHLNQMHCGRFRKYSAEIPEILYNRPKAFVKHCLERAESARNVKTDSVKEVNNQTYSVIVKKRTYIVYLGDDANYPCCECQDWTTHHMPCMHMFCAMNIDGNISWNVLSPIYMQSVYCNIDVDVLTRETCSTDENESGNVNEDTLHHSNEEDSSTTEVECHQRRTRDGLKKLSGLTYNITDISVLKSLQSTVQKMIEEVEEVETMPKSRFLPLRKRVSLKTYARRSGAKASLLKKHSKMDISANVPVTPTSELLVPTEEIRKTENTESVKPCFPFDYGPQDNQAQINEVQRIWTDNSINMPARSVGPYVITTQSIRCINGLLSDEVIDSDLHNLTSTMDRTYHINCIAMTAIFEGQLQIHNCLRRVPSLTTYDSLIGGYNQAGCHWCLIIVRPKEKQIMFLNPLGTLHIQEQDILIKWFNFLKARCEAGLETPSTDNWTMTSQRHAKQSDGSSCGVYVLKFAENYLGDRTLYFKWTKVDVHAARVSLAAYLLSISQPTQSIDIGNEEYVEIVELKNGGEQKISEESTENVQSGKDADVEIVEPKIDVEPKIQKGLKGKRVHDRNKPKKKMSSFYYPSWKKGSTIHCICEQPYKEGDCMWCCDKCEVWFHPHCIGRDDLECPPSKKTSFLCEHCLSSEAKKWPVDYLPVLADDSDDEDGDKGYLVTVKEVHNYMTKAYMRVWYILRLEGNESKVHWSKRHFDYVNEDGLPPSHGFGEALFTQPAIFTIKLNMQKRFAEKKKKSLYTTHLVIPGMANEEVNKKIYDNIGEAENYINKVLMKEAMVVILQEITNLSYLDAESELLKTEARSIRLANQKFLNYVTNERDKFMGQIALKSHCKIDDSTG